MKWMVVVGERLWRNTPGMGVLFLTLFALSLCAVPNLPYTTLADKRVCGIGRISNLDVFVLDTQDIILECFSNKARRLSFKIGTEPYPVEEKYIVERNQTYVKLVIPNVSKQNVSEYLRKRFVQCLDIDTKECIDNAFIELEYYPRPVLDNQCVMHDFNELFCNWSLGFPPYKFPERINVTSSFMFSQSTLESHSLQAWMPCPNGNQTYCYWNSNSLLDKGVILELDVLINVTNTKLNISKITEKHYFRDDIVLPSPVQNLTSSLTDDPTCVLLRWKQISSKRNFKNNISYHSACDMVEQSTMEQTECSKSSCTYRLCGLLPNTMYNVSVVIRFCPKGKEKGYWSFPAHIKTLTAEAVPKKSPTMIPGLYIWQTDGIIMYFQPLTSCEIHSNKTRYEIGVNDVRNIIPWTEFQRKIAVPKTFQTEGCSISVQAKNDIGRAPEISTLEIDPQKEVPKDSLLIVEYLRKEGEAPRYFAEIRIDEDNLRHFENITHTLTWCKSISAIGCKEPIKWLDDITARNGIQIPVGSDSEEYEFGLVTKGYSKRLKKMVSTDIQLAQCLYLYNTAPQKPLPGVTLAKAIPPKSLTVEWEGYQCQKSIVYLQNSVSYVENYIVTFCSSEQPAGNNSCVCLEQATNVSVSRSLKEYTLKDLTPGGYCVWVSANNSHGLGPRNSNSLFHMVIDGNDSNTWIIVAIVFGVVFIIIMIPVVKVVVRCYGWIKEWVKARKRVIVPDVIGDEPMSVVTPELPPRQRMDIYSHTEDRSITETSLNQLIDNDEGIFEESRSPLLGYAIAEDIESGSNMSLISQLSQVQGHDIVEDIESGSNMSLISQLSQVQGHDIVEDIESGSNMSLISQLSQVQGHDIVEDIECGSNLSLNSQLSEVKDFQNIECCSTEDVFVWVNTAINADTSYKVTDSKTEMVSDDSIDSCDPCDEKVSAAMQEISEFDKVYGEVTDICSGHHFVESEHTAAELNDENLCCSENTCLDGFSVATETNISNPSTDLKNLKPCDTDHSDSSIETDYDCEAIGWCSASITGYSAIPLTNPCSDLPEDSDFDGPLDKDTIYSDTLPQMENIVSAQSDESAISVQSRDRDSAVFLSDNSTDSSVEQAVFKHSSITYLNAVEETGQCTELSALSLTTSDYEGSNDQKLESVKATKDDRKEILGVKDKSAEPKEGYSQAKHIEI